MDNSNVSKNTMAEENKDMNPMAAMVGDVLLQRVKSQVPCTCTNTESTVLPVPLSQCWEKFRYWKLE